MATGKPLPFRRRTFLIKHGFQIRFAVYPVVFLGLFLGLAGSYLFMHLQEVLRLQLYLPHSRLQDPWQVVAPAVGRVAAWGGAAFLAVLSAWVWARFARLRGDLERLADWLGGLARGVSPGQPPRLSDAEVRALGEGLQEAAQRFTAWDQDVTARGRALLDVIESIGREGGSNPREILPAVMEVREAISTVHLEEDLS